MNIAPKAHFIRSLRAERGDLVRLCGEAIDNSFDASARRVQVEINTDEIKFIDDGNGILLDNFPAVFTYGAHVSLKDTALGRFGVGIFVQAISAADAMEARSISADGHYSFGLNWRTVLRDGFEVGDPYQLPMVVGTPTGTTITLTHRRQLKPCSIAALIEALALAFYPAIAGGRTISVNNNPVPLLTDPPMDEIVDRTFDFSNGRRAILHAGLLTRPSKVNRVHVAFGHRVIKAASTYGCGAYTGLTNMFARVQLTGNQWALTTFKDGLANEDQLEELEDALEEALTPILVKCGSISMEVRVATIGELMNELLPSELAVGRPRHKNPKHSGNKGHSGRSGTVHEEQADPAPSPAKIKRSQAKLLLTWEGNNANHGIGWFEPGRINRVHLSPDNPKILELFRQRDDMVVALATMLIGVLLFEEGREEMTDQPELKLEPFGVRVARHLTRNDIPILQTEVS